MTVDDAIDLARQRGVDRLDAQLLLAHRLGRARTWVIAHGDEPVETDALSGFEADCERRRDDVPLAYLLGEREFRGLTLAVTPAVLVPRPDTEALVDWAIELLAQRLPASSQVLDLGTGSGAVALAIAAARPDARVSATDVDDGALALASTNARHLGLPVEFVRGSWWSAVGARRFDLVVSNPPYVAECDPHLHALRHEPQHALRAGDDGLAAVREIVAGAPRHLGPGGWLLLEHGCDQAAAVGALLRQSGFVEVSTRCDLAGQPRCSGGRRPDSSAR